MVYVCPAGTIDDTMLLVVDGARAGIHEDIPGIDSADDGSCLNER